MAAERPDPVVRLLEELTALDRAYSPGHHGRWSARHRAGIVDRCVRGLFDDAAPPPGVALAALGGYGRGALAPRSDVDLLLVHEGGAPGEVRGVAERLLYPLWDAGVAVGHAVRTPEECLAFAAGRLENATAMLGARRIAGDAGVLEQALRLVLGWLREDPRGFAARLREAAGERAERYGAVSRLLEPDLKEGRGGLRDVHAIGWLARVALDGPPEALVGYGLLREGELRALDEAEEFLTRARSVLHLETGRRTDRLLLEHQPGAAREMGFRDEPGLTAPDGLLRAILEHGRQVEHASASALERFLAGRRRAVVQLEPTPAGVLRAFARLARSGERPSPRLLDAAEGAGIPDPVAWDEPTRDAFLDLLRVGEEAAAALDGLDRLGLLVRYLPEWAPVRCRPQRDPYHRSPVDVHLLETLATAARILDGAEDEDRVAREARSLVPDRAGYLLGALLHDVGKIGEPGHVAVGARQARAALDRMGLPSATRDLALFLVEHHLLLADTATRRDLEDDDLILDVAATVGDPGRLAALYLLTVADARATGPAAWTPWRQALVRELVAKVQHVLERGEMGPEIAERLALRAEEVRAALAGEEEGEVERFLLRVPRGYLLTVPAARAVGHFRLLRAPLGGHEVRTAVGRGTTAGTYALTVVAADRPGLLSRIAGALAVAGLSILSAQVFTTADGVAVDLFEVEGVFEREVDASRWRGFRQTLRRALEDRLALEHLVEEKRLRYPPPRADVPVRVAVDNAASDFFTVIEVGAPDRIGLLFDVTRTLAELGLDVHLAKVATYGGRVVDAFYVRDALGRKLDGARAVELERALTSRLAA